MEWERLGRGDAALGRGAEEAPGTDGILTALSEKGASLGKIWGKSKERDPEAGKACVLQV